MTGLRTSLAGLAAIGALGLAPPALAAPRALVILPPGEGNTITPAGFAQYQADGDCADLGPNYCDQLNAYEHWRFRSAGLAADAAHVAGAVRTESPETGVTIVRDGAGVPHVFARGPNEQTIEERLAYGIGYAQAEERPFQMEILRRAGEGRLSDLLGPAYVQMDLVSRRDSESPAERQAEVNALPPGQRRSLQAYADGINAVIQRDTTSPSLMPTGFLATQDLPIAPWTATDTVAVITLEVKGVAESAGNEVGYGSFARRLAAHYGLRRAVGILDDVQLTRDPRSPTTIPHGQRARDTTDHLRYGYIRYTRRDTARRIAALGPSVDAARRAVVSGDRAVATATNHLGLPVFGSNAWAISQRRSKTGGALLWGGPQVSYYAPAVLDELEVEGGQFHEHGVGVPGGGPGVVIGFTPHTAWSITTAQDDQVDTYVDRIRKAPGGGGYQYRWRGRWLPVVQRTETIRSRVAAPSFGGIGPPAPPAYMQQSVTYYRTFQGSGAAREPCIVVHLDPKAGLAYCKVRAFWGQELTTGRSIVEVDRATGLASFAAAVRKGIAGFNFIYADDRGHIGYWHTGRVPIRARGHDPRLPAPGDGRFDWRGFLSPRRWPSVVDPAQGWIASWNNKPQRSWLDSGDGTLWGAYQRVRVPMALLRAHRRRFDRTATWRVARRTGELDLRERLGFKPLLVKVRRLHRLSAIERAAIRQVARWDGTAFYPDGAERTSSGQETGRVRAPGFAILSAWFHALERRVAARVFRRVTGNGNAALGVRAFTQTSATTSPEFEFFNDYDAFLYNVLTHRARGARYLGHGGALAVSRAALDDAIAALRSKQGSDPSRWRAPMPQIQFQSLDVADLPSVPWENRGTWGEAIALPPLSSPAPGG